MRKGVGVGMGEKGKEGRREGPDGERRKREYTHPFINSCVHP